MKVNVYIGLAGLVTGAICTILAVYGQAEWYWISVGLAAARVSNPVATLE